MHDHPHDETTFQPDHDTGPATPYEVLEQSLRELLIEKAVLSNAEISAHIDRLATRNAALGAKVTARAWIDPAFKQHYLTDTKAALPVWTSTSAIAEYRVVENTPDLHNVIVCTLCSCYPKLLLGYPPAWYKSVTYRSRTVREPRTVLAEFGVDLPKTSKSVCTIPPLIFVTSCFLHNHRPHRWPLKSWRQQSVAIVSSVRRFQQSLKHAPSQYRYTSPTAAFPPRYRDDL